MRKKFLRAIILSVLVVLIGFGYMNIKYSQVDSQLRLKGVIYDQFIRFNDVESLKIMSRKSRERLLEPINGIQYEEVNIEIEHGKMVRTLIYRSRTDKGNATGLLWLHGGGYASGTPESELKFAKTIVGETNSVVVIPDYTLTTEAPYPAALDDAYGVLVWMKKNAESLGMNENQIFVGGGSAGGGLTAAVTMYARDQEEVKVAFQMPLFPMLNDKMDNPSGINNEELIWNTKRNSIAWEAYLGEYFQGEDVPIYASPLRSKEFTNLPPTYTYVGNLDPFLDDTKIYVECLRKAEVEVEFHQYDGAYHGFEGVAPNADISKLAAKRLVHAYKEATERFYVEK